MGLLDHIVALSLNFWETAIHSIQAMLFYVPVSSVQGLSFLHIITNIYIYIWLSPECVLGLCWRSTDCKCVHALPGFLFCSIALYICIYPSAVMFWLLQLYSMYAFKPGIMIPLALFSLFKIGLATWDLLGFHLNFTIGKVLRRYET